MPEFIQLFGNKILNVVVAKDPYNDISTNGVGDITYIPLEDVPQENRDTIRPLYIYNKEEKKAYPEKPALYSSWIFDEKNMMWVPPFDPPQDGKNYIWDEGSVNYKEFIEEETPPE